MTIAKPQQYKHDMAPGEMIERLGPRPDGREGPYPIIIECGCHDGRDTEQFLEAFPESYLMCFEPDPRPLYRHDPPGFFDRIGIDPRVTLYEAAVGDHNGTVLLNRSSGTPPGNKWNTNDWDHSSSVCRPTKHLERHPWCTFPARLRMPVTMVTLNLFATRLPHLDFIWADVQGAEEKLITGCLQKTLSRTRWFYTEFDDSAQYEGQPDLTTIRGLLAVVGLKLVATYNYNALFHNPDIR